MQPRQLGELAMLLGGKVTQLARSGKQDGDDEIFGIVIQQTNGKKMTLWLLSDFEGKPGGYSIEPYEQGDEQP
jgi:hypothetical protein